MLKNHETIFPEVTFDMDFWHQPLECGTAACAFGSACSYFKELEIHGGIPFFGELIEYEAAEAFFEITEEQAEYLFDPNSYEEWTVSRSEVIERIKELLK